MLEFGYGKVLRRKQWYIEDITCPLVDMNFIFSCSTRYLTSEWQRMDTNWRPKTNRNIRHWVLLRKRELSLEKPKNIKIIIFLIHEQFSRPSCKCWVTQKLRNSSVVHHRTKSPFGAKICVNISFQLLLYIMKVKSQEDKQFCNLNFSDVMWKPGILRSQVTHLIWLPYQCHLEVFWMGKGKQINTPLIFFASISYNLPCVLCSL